MKEEARESKKAENETQKLTDQSSVTITEDTVEAPEAVKSEAAVELSGVEAQEAAKAETMAEETKAVKAETLTDSEDTAKTEGTANAGSIVKTVDASGTEGTDSAKAVHTGEIENAEPDQEDAAKQKEKPLTAKKKWPLITAAGLLLLLAGVYGGIAFYYQTHFLPNTVINGVDCSGMKAEAVAALLDAQIMDYSLEVTGRDYATGASGASLGVVSAADIQLANVGTLETVQHILGEQNPLLWIQTLYNLQSSHSLVQGVTFDQNLLASVVREWQACQDRNMKTPQNAYISEYSEVLQGYEIIPETNGTQLEVEQVIQAAANAIEMHELTLDVETLGIYKAAEIKREDPRLTETVETANRWLSTEITYDWNGEPVVLDMETIRDWVTIEDGKAVLDEEAVAEFVKAQAREYDTYGKNKNFVTTLGVELTLRSPNYGWRTDTESETAELIALIRRGAVGEREPIYLNTAGQKGMSDIGSSYAEADLTNQHMYFYYDGELVLETDFVSGNMSSDPGNRTPQGIYGLTYKTRNAVLRGANYATPVSYWMPFYGNYGMHDANWRAVFGGNIYLTSGSHGCINLPPSMASQIYEYVYTGFPVICYYYPEGTNPKPQVPVEQEPMEPMPEGIPDETPVEQAVEE